MVSKINSINSSSIKVGDVEPDQKVKLVELLGRYVHCFSSGDDDLGLTNLGEMEIKLTKHLSVLSTVPTVYSRMAKGQR